MSFDALLLLIFGPLFLINLVIIYLGFIGLYRDIYRNSKSQKGTK